MLESLIALIPLIIASIVPPMITAFRAYVAALVPGRLIPLLLPIGGALVAVVSQAVGYDIGDFNAETADLTAWQTAITGALVGLATVGVHQVGVQLKR